MHNLYATFAKFLDICKEFSCNLVNAHGNIPRPGVVPRFSDLEVVSLSLTMESLGLDSEHYLFCKLKEYLRELPHLISRRQFNDRRKYTSTLCKAICERIVADMDGEQENFCVDSKSIEVCCISRYSPIM